MLELAVVTGLFIASAFYNAQIYGEFYVQRQNQTMQEQVYLSILNNAHDQCNKLSIPRDTADRIVDTITKTFRYKLY